MAVPSWSANRVGIATAGWPLRGGRGTKKAKIQKKIIKEITALKGQWHEKLCSLPLLSKLKNCMVNSKSSVWLVVDTSYESEFRNCKSKKIPELTLHISDRASSSSVDLLFLLFTLYKFGKIFHKY